MVAPIIPGLNDSEAPSILEAAKAAGAMTAGYILLRLPLTVEPVFIEWLERTQNQKAQKVVSRVQQTRGGKLNSSKWGERMVGRGAIAEQIESMFRLFRRQLGLELRLPELNRDDFRPPPSPQGQLRLF